MVTHYVINHIHSFHLVISYGDPSAPAHCLKMPGRNRSSLGRILTYVVSGLLANVVLKVRVGLAVSRDVSVVRIDPHVFSVSSLVNVTVCSLVKRRAFGRGVSRVAYTAGTFHHITLTALALLIPLNQL